MTSELVCRFNYYLADVLVLIGGRLGSGHNNFPLKFEAVDARTSQFHFLVNLELRKNAYILELIG